MSTDSNPLGLYIPVQTIDYPDAPYLKPREAEKWIASLPIAHTGETARLVYKAMAEINRISMPAKQRFQVLEHFRKPFQFVSKALQKHYIGQAFPLSQKNQKIAELTRELQWEIASGYKIIIDASLTKKFGRVDSKTLTTSIYRAMYYLSETLYKSYLVYLPANKQAWLELHHLYLFSEHNALISDKVKDPLNNELPINSIGKLYKHALLLSLANPYRLPQPEIIKVYNALNNWAEYSHLCILTDPDNPSGLFSINLDSATPPSYFSKSHKDLSANYIRILDTGELTRVLRDQVDSIENDNHSVLDNAHLTEETIRRLILAWGAVPKRNFSRKGKKEKISVTLGLAGTHYFIQKQTEAEFSASQSDDDKDYFSDSEVAFRDKAEFESSPVSSDFLDNENAPNIWDIAQNPNLKNNQDSSIPEFDGDKNKSKTDNPFTSNSEIYSSYRCLLINESAGGYCISWENTNSTKTVVGALIGLKNHDTEDDSQWNIGVIRWIKSSDDNQMYIGIELLSPSSQAIASKNISPKRKSTEYSRSLLLPELRNVKQPQTLITHSLYQVGDKLELDIHGQEVKVKLTKLLENTSAFSQFQFSIVKKAKNVAPTDKLDRVKNFDSLWSSI